MAKKEAPKVEKESQKAGKASMCTNRNKPTEASQYLLTLFDLWHKYGEDAVF